MTLTFIAFTLLTLAALPAALFVLNLWVYRRTQPVPISPLPPVSVLIPARDEERNLPATLRSVLANRGVEFEVVVLDDHSTDQTVRIVQEIARNDGRVRLESAPKLPAGWCGKQHACHTLAQLARKPFLVFMDADVRLAPDALARMAAHLQFTGADLASGVPRQELGTFSERLLLPLIHFILLGFLPMAWARRTASPAFAAGCGQLFITRADAYRAAGGHASIRASLHDGLQLPRAFRRAGQRTELFDATDLAACRMYHRNAEVWSGLGKNAMEGLAAPGTLLPMTFLLVGGQIAPLLTLGICAGVLGPGQRAVLLAAVALGLLPRLLAVVCFRQPLGAALLHPLAVACLLGIQWTARVRHRLGHPSVWRGRAYPATTALDPAASTRQSL